MLAGPSRAPRRLRLTSVLLAVSVAIVVVPASLAPWVVRAAGTPTVTALSPEAGPSGGGTTVTITGTNFDSTSTVYFGLQPGINVTVLSSTQLTVVTPQDAETQETVTVATTTGGTSTANAPYTNFQFANPGPFVPLNADICDNQNDGNTTQCATHGPLSNVFPQNSLNVQVTGKAGIPASGVAAVAVELFTAPTGTGSSTSYGNVGVYPTGLAGGASDLSWVNGNNGTLLIEIPVGQNGQITITNSTTSKASVNFILDVEGYVADTQTNASGLINALPSSTVICNTLTTSSPCYIAGNAGLAPGHWLQFPVLGQGGVPGTPGVTPSGVSAVVLDVQTYGENGVGWGVAYPDGQPMPPVASVLWNTGMPLTTHTIVPVDSTGKIAFYNGGPGATQVSISVDGWFTDNSNSSATGGLYNPNNGTLVCDTITGTGTPCSTGTKLTAGAAMPVQVGGQGGVPMEGATLTGVELSITVTNESGVGNGTYVCVYASNSSCQEADLNLYGGVPANLLVIVPLGPDGKVDVYTPTGSMDVLISVTGYYTDDPVGGDCNHETGYVISNGQLTGEGFIQCTGLMGRLSNYVTLWYEPTNTLAARAGQSNNCTNCYQASAQSATTPALPSQEYRVDYTVNMTTYSDEVFIHWDMNHCSPTAYYPGTQFPIALQCTWSYFFYAMTTPTAVTTGPYYTYFGPPPS